MDVDTLLARTGGVATRTLLLRIGHSRHEIDNALRRGELVTLSRATYCRPWDADQIEVLECAAVLALAPASALSHVSALRRWGLQVPSHQVHLTVPARRCPRPRPGVVIHRAGTFPSVVRLKGVVTVTAPIAIARSWPLLPAADRRGPAIEAVRSRLVRPDELRASVQALARAPGRAELLKLAGLLAGGCESELEIWGHLHVFDVPGLRHCVRQRWFQVNGRRYRADVAYEVERVVVELDGARAHSTQQQREHDMQRDAALASAGWVTIRLSHWRLHNDVDGCRRDLLAVLARRRSGGVA